MWGHCTGQNRHRSKPTPTLTPISALCTCETTIPEGVSDCPHGPQLAHHPGLGSGPRRGHPLGPREAEGWLTPCREIRGAPKMTISAMGGEVRAGRWGKKGGYRERHSWGSPLWLQLCPFPGLPSNPHIPRSDSVTWGGLLSLSSQALPPVMWSPLSQ